MPDLGDIVRDSYNPIIRAIRTLEKPVVCAVNGVAAGAGANLAFACDIVFAADDATFIQSFAKIGVIPDSGGTFILPRLVGCSARPRHDDARREDDAAAGARVGTRLHGRPSPTRCSETASARAQQLATQPTRALGLIKRGFNKSLGIDLDDAARLEEELQREAGRTADYAEGVRAFLEKRKPVFTGR